MSFRFIFTFEKTSCKKNALLQNQPVAIAQQFPTGVLKELVKHAEPDYSVSSTDPFPLDCQI